MAMADALNGEKKKLVLNNLEQYANGNKHALLRRALKAFAIKAEEAKVFNYFIEINNYKAIRAINLRLLKTVAGSIFDSFNRWKTIPEEKADQDYKKAS
jgi:hypothetical protein